MTVQDRTVLLQKTRRCKLERLLTLALNWHALLALSGSESMFASSLAAPQESIA